MSTATATSETLYIVTLSDDLGDERLAEMWDELGHGARSLTSFAAWPWDEYDELHAVVAVVEASDAEKFEDWAESEDGIENYKRVQGRYVPADEYDGDHNNTWDGKDYVLVIETED